MLALSFHLDAVWDLVGKLHPALVHFPVACLVIAGLLEAYSWRKRRPVSDAAVLLIRVGAAAAILAAISGWSFADGESPSRNLFLHRWGGIAVAVLACGAAWLTRGRHPRRALRPLAIALFPLVGFVGHLGGELAWGKDYLTNAVREIFADRAEPSPTVALTPDEQHFIDVVWPVLRDNCLECHGPREQKADLRVDDPAIVLVPEFVVPGDTATSYLAEVLRFPDDDEYRMPPADEGPPLPEATIVLIERWIADGAAWPDVPLPGHPGEPEPGEVEEDDDDEETGWRGPLGPRTAHAETQDDEPDPVPPAPVPSDPVPSDPVGAELFRTVVRPTLRARCVECHGPEKRKGRLHLDRPDDVLDEDRPERIVVPGDPAASALFERITLPADDEDRMPPKGERLSEEQVAGIRAWIAAGAPWPENAAGDAREETPPSDGAAPTGAPGAYDVREVALILYRSMIQPLLVERCQGCHGPQESNGGFRVDEQGPLLARISPGSPERSALIERVMRAPDAEGHMPRKGRPLTPLEVEALSTWIAVGAPLPARRRPPPGDGVPAPAYGAVSEPRISLTQEQSVTVERALATLGESGARAGRRALGDAAVEVSATPLGADADDAWLSRLSGLEPALVRLDLSASSVTDGGARTLTAYGELRVLNLSRTAVGDAAVAELARLPHLEVLNLYETRVTDAGIAALHEHPTLRRVYLWRTGVTDAGVEALRAARPELRIVRGR